jgi:hypothetical protein
MRLAEDEVDWVVGFLDECWWSRVAQPNLHSFERSRRASASGGAVSRKRRPRSEGHLLLRALCARVGEDVAAFRGRATRKRHNQAFFGVVLGKVGRHRQEGLGVDLGQRQLAHKPGGTSLDWKIQPRGQS